MRDATDRSQLFAARTPEHEELCSKKVDSFPVLIEHRATHGHDALLRLRTRQRDFDNFTFDLQSIAWPRGLGPGDFSAEADNAISEWQAAVNQEPHGNGGGMPAAGRQSFKDARPCRRFVEMERLGVELGGELFNTRRFHQITS